MKTNRKNKLYRLSLLFLVLALVLGACRPKPPAQTPTPTAGAANLPVGPTAPATATATATPPIPDSGLQVVDDGSPLPPQVIERQPAGAQALAPDGALQLTFDQAMNTQKTAAALKVTTPDGKAIAGQTSWTGDRTLNFKPAQALQTGSLYYASLDLGAASQAGQALREPYEFQFVTSGDLQVSQVFPGDGSSKVSTGAVITAIFNRPVVPLVIAEEQNKLIQPLQISPAVEGVGEWVNTSVYTFRPAKVLRSGTQYTIKISAGLQDALEETSLPQDYTWSFTTAQPGIDFFERSNGERNPSNNTQNVLLDEGFRIRFLQPMDVSSTEAALSLTGQNGEKTLLQTLWNQDFTQVAITPTQRLALDTNYTLAVGQGAQAANGGGLEDGVKWNFHTVLYPAIQYTRPANGSQQDYFNSNLYIKFVSPMRLDTVKERIVITPAPEKDFEWWYNDWEWSIMAFVLKPSTNYEVRFLPGMEDIYGNVIQSEKVVRFKTAPYAAEASLLMPYNLSIFRADGPEDAQDFYAAYRNVSQVSFELYSLTPQQVMDFQIGRTSSYKYQPPAENLVWKAQEQSTGTLNERTVKSYHPTLESGQPLPTGFYFLGIKAPEVKNEAPWADLRILMMANANLTFKTSSDQALVWLTGLEDGKPLADARVTVYDDNFNAIGEGSSDADGLLVLKVPTPKDPYSARFALSEDGKVFAFASNQWGSGVNLYDYGIWSSYYAPINQPTAYVYTERPIYRPGQPVYFKGIVRLDDDLDYTIPRQETAYVTISSYEETVYEENLPLSAFGSFAGELKLDAEAALGYYTIDVYTAKDDQHIGGITFNVAEYRRPEFQVSVNIEPKDLLAGENFTAQVKAEYYSGGGVADAAVHWTLLAEPFYFNPPDKFTAFSFIDREDDLYYGGYGDEGGYGGLLAEGDGKTDLRGNFSVTLPADLNEAAASQRLTFEATTTDVSGNAVSGRDSLVAHLSGVYPGIKSKSYVGVAGEEQSFDLVALDWNGAPLAGQKLNVEIVERRWYSVQEQDASGRVEWKSSVEEKPVASFDDLVTDADGLASVTFTPPAGGVYRARVTALDYMGNPGKASAYLWVSGKEYIPWRQTNDRNFNLISDRTTYSPGDSAELLIASPFQGQAYALLTVERGRVRKQEVLLLTNNSTIYQLPITPDMAPNVYVEVLIVKGVDETSPRPNFKMGIAELKVNTQAQELTVKLSATPAQAGPRQQVVYNVKTLDAAGQPVSAEVSLGLSDLATLSLLPPNSAPILEHFYSHRSLGVWTSVPLAFSIDEFNAELDKQEAEGAAMGSGGGKGEGDLGVMAVRQDFPDTALWEAQVVTNARGEANVSVTLPDNLTTWRMDARAVTGDTLVGQASLDLVSTKPLLVRPQTPRFFVINDKVRLGAAINNNTDQNLDVVVSLAEAQGLTLNSPISQTISVPAHRQAYASWQATVNPDAQRVDLIFSAESGEYSDASRPTLSTLEGNGIPVYRYEAHETVGTSGMMTDNGTLLEAISLPKDMQVSEGDLTIKVSPSLAAGMTDALTYLKHFPYECVEQTISRFLPNVVTSRALKSAGLDDPALEAELKTQVETALQRLYNWQNPDGGWGWWGTNKSEPLTTAYVLLGLVEAQDAGYTVSKDVLQRGLNYLRTQIKPMPGLVEPYKVNRQAFFLYVLARAGQPDVSNSVQLYETQRQRMALYARAFLAQTLFIIEPNSPRIDTLLSDFNNAAIVSATGTHWEEGEIDRWNWNTDTRTTAIVLATLSLANPENPLNANAVRWLMSHRDSGHWKGTQETAWSLMALTNWMTASGELKANYEYAVALNGERLGGGQANRETLRQTLELKVGVADLLKDEANRLAFARAGGQGNLYYTAHLDVSLPVEQTKALDQGIIVSRNYYQLDDLKTPVTEAKQGNLLLVRVTIVAPSALHYVVIDDPLPAGLEAVDQSLETSPQNTQTPQAFTWDDMLWKGWGWWFFSRTQLRDEKAVLSADYLPAGTYIFTYLARASTVGEFRVIPTTAQEFYFPEVYGRGEGSLFSVKP